MYLFLCRFWITVVYGNTVKPKIMNLKISTGIYSFFNVNSLQNCFKRPCKCYENVWFLLKPKHSLDIVESFSLSTKMQLQFLLLLIQTLTIKIPDKDEA